MTRTVDLQDDERRLAELGYKQELQRAWSGFSNCVWWAVQAKHTFKGPVRTVEFDEGAGVT